MYKAVITITFKPGILDPQGTAVQKALKSLGYENVLDVLVGKHMEIRLNSPSREEALRQLDEMCSKLLANPVIEDYAVDLTEVEK